MKKILLTTMVAYLMTGCATNAALKQEGGITAVISTSFTEDCKSEVKNVLLEIEGVTDPDFSKLLVIRNMFSKYEVEETYTHVYPMVLKKGEYKVTKMRKPNIIFAAIMDKYPLTNSYTFKVDGPEEQYIGAFNLSSPAEECHIRVMELNVEDMRDRDMKKAMEMTPELFQ